MRVSPRLSRWSLPPVLIAASCALPTPEQSGKIHCENDGDCLSGRVCVAGECQDSRDEQPSLVPTCPDTPCTGTDSCYWGFCGTATATACDAYALDDGCPSNALCYSSDPDTTFCLTLPACNSQVECPIGPQGAVCNLGDWPGKNGICLPGYCKDATDCPTDWRCVRLTGSDPLGLCGSGDPMSPCATGADCHSGNCDAFLHACG